MIAGSASLDTRALAALLVGEPLPWTSLRTTPSEFWLACDDERLTGLVSQRVSALTEDSWPSDVRRPLIAYLSAQTATELLRQRELIAVLAVLADEGIQPVILKGTALAHGVYNSPAARPRADTDLLIRRDQVERTQRVLAGLGYGTPLQCEGELLFGQFSRKRTDRFGLTHALDVHWRLSSQSVFADVLRFDEVVVHAEPVEALGPHARMAGRVHALILACIHPAMHHGNRGPLIWQYDIHLLASRLSDADWQAYAEFAAARRVSAICAHQLASARARFATHVPESVLSMLAVDRHEPSAAYLRVGRRRVQDMLYNVRGLSRWSDRARLVREMLLPSPAYMLQSYGVPPSWLGRALLPVLYSHRLATGLVKVTARRN